MFKLRTQAIVGAIVVAGATLIAVASVAHGADPRLAAAPSAATTLQPNDMYVSVVNASYFLSSQKKLRASCNVEVRDGNGAYVHNAVVTAQMTTTSSAMIRIDHSG